MEKQYEPLTDKELEQAIQSVPYAVYALMQKDCTAENFKKALLLIARAVEKRIIEQK